MTTLNKKLSVIALILFLLCAFSYLPFVRQKSAPKAFQSALLNPSHKDEVTEIVIEKKGDGTDAADFTDGSDGMNGANSGRKIVLQKAFGDAQKAFWTASDGLTTVRADKKVVENLLTNIIKIRKMYEISDNNMNVSFLSTSRTTLIFQNDSKMYTKLSFFGTNSLTNRLMLSTESKPSLYETEDDISQFLQPTVRYWAKPELVQTIDEPVSFSFQEKGRSPVTIDHQYSADFAEISHDVMALRHGAVLPVQSPAATERTAVLHIIAPDGAQESVSFYQQSDGYLCTYDCNPHSSADTVSFSFEISGWTYNRLKAIFTDR